MGQVKVELTCPTGQVAAKVNAVPRCVSTLNPGSLNVQLGHLSFEIGDPLVHQAVRNWMISTYPEAPPIFFKFYHVEALTSLLSLMPRMRAGESSGDLARLEMGKLRFSRLLDITNGSFFFLSKKI